MTRVLPLFFCGALLGCQPVTMGEPTLELMGARPIDDLGEALTFRVVATRPDGKVGSGPVEFKSFSGSLNPPKSVELDSFGTATVDFSCDADVDSTCSAMIDVYATWFYDGIPVRASKAIQVGQPPEPPPPPITWESGVQFPPGDNGGPCPFILRDAGPLTRCSANQCRAGFTCTNGRCALNGNLGTLQATMRMGEPVDLDLHFFEPSDAGICHVYYGNRNNPPSGGCRSSLDLDSNAGCSTDNINTENIVFTQDRPRPGNYKVEVDLFSPCLRTEIPYELKLRVGVVSKYYCNGFGPDGGSRRHSYSDLIVP